MQKKYDVAILGWWYGLNYGSILTYYSLHKAISDLGYNILMVHESLGYNGWRVKWDDDIMSLNFARRMGYHYTEQLHYSKLDTLNYESSTFLVGSDQLWNPLIGRVNDDLFLDFVSPENKRVAYATSFGNKTTNKFKPDFVKKHSNNLQQFSSISVREAYAIDTAKNIFGVEATQVVDPVFLVDRKHYENLADQATITIDDKYMLIFILDPTDEKRKVTLSVAKKLGFEKIVVIPNPDQGREKAVKVFHDDIFYIIPEDGPENFLYAYKNASYVVTDSFHGTAFSIILQCPFSSIYNEKRGADRFVNILGEFGYGENRRLFLTDNDETIAANKNISLNIDFELAEQILQKKKEKSIGWLKSALETPKKKALPTYIPTLHSNFDLCKINNTRKSSKIIINNNGNKKGNHIWFDLPNISKTSKGKAYRLTLNWNVQTIIKNVNLHLRNSETGKFKLIGSVKASGKVGVKTDFVDFIVENDSFNQIMIGALHLYGNFPFIEIFNVTLESIDTKNMVNSIPLSSEDKLKILYEADRNRFFRSYANKMTSHNKQNAQALLMFHSHALEKGLSHLDFRAGFGRVAIPGLVTEMNKWVKAGEDINNYFFQIGLSVLSTYFKKHYKLNIDVSHFWKLIDKHIQKLIEKTNENFGGILPANEEREHKVITKNNKNFIDVVYDRRSIRNFTNELVSDDLIEKAINIAIQAPSVCNRQPARVHSFDNQELMKKALKLQGGYSGYEMPPKLLLVTSDLGAYLFPDERNQAYIDGGLFMMNLLLGLEYVGIGACSLNTAMSDQFSNKERKLLDIPDSEVFIAFIAIGNYEKDILVPRSKRLSVNEVLIKHT